MSVDNVTTREPFSITFFRKTRVMLGAAGEEDEAARRNGEVLEFKACGEFSLVNDKSPNKFS